jgi:nucleotide-binding universal stress UspA family protein
MEVAFDAVRMSTIVTGVDGSPGGARAVRWAAARSLEVGGELVAVHVLTYNREFNRDIGLETVTTWRRDLSKNLEGAWTDRLLGATTYVVAHRARTPVVIIPVDWAPRAA